jgi:hypothetical protein
LSRKNKKKQPDYALGRTFGPSAFTKIENPQTQNRRGKPSNSYPIYKQSNQNLQSQPHPYPYRLQEEETEEGMSTKRDTAERDEKERKRKREELTLSTTEASGLQRETPRETVGERAGEVGRLKRLPRDGESER